MVAPNVFAARKLKRQQQEQQQEKDDYYNKHQKQKQPDSAVAAEPNPAEEVSSSVLQIVGDGPRFGRRIDLQGLASVPAPQHASLVAILLS